jgi:uncharacterized Tic20 family protein
MHLATFLTFLESGRKKREIPCKNFVIKLLLVFFLKRTHSHFIDLKNKSSYNYKASAEITVA